MSGNIEEQREEINEQVEVKEEMKQVEKVPEINQEVDTNQAENNQHEKEENINQQEKESNQQINKEKTTVLKAEIDHFTEKSNFWWNPEGECKPLHTLNDLRVPYVKNTLHQMGFLKEENLNTAFPLKGIKILDAGCGGGLFSEPLAKLGADVTGIDPTEKLIKVAKEHAALDPSLQDNLHYLLTTVEEHAKENENKYDCVVSSEVLEHITEHELFLEGCAKCVKPGGSVIVSTFAKTFLGRVMSIWITEYVFNVIPRGAHNYDMFITHETVSRMLDKYKCKTKEVKGCFINPFTYRWGNSSPSIHYILHAVKNE